MVLIGFLNAEGRSHVRSCLEQPTNPLTHNELRDFIFMIHPANIVRNSWKDSGLSVEAGSVWLVTLGESTCGAMEGSI